MSKPCIVEIKGKKYSYEEYLSVLHDGLLDSLVKQDILDDTKFKKVEVVEQDGKGKTLDDNKQRVAERIVKGDSNLDAIKQHIEEQGYDKGEYDSKQIFKDVDELIKKYGIENVEQFADRTSTLSEPHRVVLQAKLAEYYGKKSISDEEMSEDERKEAMFKSSQLFMDLSKQRTEAGRGNAILNQVYLDSDIYFMLPYFEDKMKAMGVQLSDSERSEIQKLSDEIVDLRKENTKLQELAKKETDQQIIDDITTHLLVDELIVDSKIKDDIEVQKAKNVLAKGFQDIARMLGGIKMATQEERVTFSKTILDMTKATMTISKIGVKNALKSVIKAIKKANPNIDSDLLSESQKYVLSEIKDTDTGIKKKNKEGLSKDELLQLVEDGADTMDKMVEAIREKYYDGDANIPAKQIRDEITNYGNSIRQSRTKVEEKLTEIKSVMLLQSKLEDALANIAPKKTGLIRDKDKIAVREKRRELAEAMKKLTVTLTEDDIAGLNERKLTQLANKIEEVEKVLAGYEKIKNKASFDYSDAVKKKQKELDDLMSSQEALLFYSKEKLNNLVNQYQNKIDKKQYSKNPVLNKLKITDKEYEKLKAELEAKKEQLKKERDNFKNNDVDFLLADSQKKINKQIAHLDKLLADIKVRRTSEEIKAEKDRKNALIDTSTNKSALDELKKNQAELEAKKEQWERKVIQKEIEIEKAKQNWLDKLGANILSVSRTLTLGVTDIGWLGVQGGYFMRTKPHLFAKALKEALKGNLSEDAFNQWKRDLKTNPMYEVMINAGLRIPSQSLRDEVFEQEFRESAFTKIIDKVPGLNVINKNGRLSVKFLANLRIEAFNQMYNGLTASQKADKEIVEKLADFVNSRSGAGMVMGEDRKRGLNKYWGLLTSARNTSAMLQQTYIGMLYGLYKNYDKKYPIYKQPIVKRQIINDALNQTALLGTLYVAYLIANALGDDDEWEVETSPFSTDYLHLKNKKGNRSYFDMGGTTALNVATLRLLTTFTNAMGTDIENFKDYKGDYSKIGAQGWGGKDGLRIMTEAIFNRTVSALAPLKNPLVAKENKDGTYYMYGKTYTPNEFRTKWITDMFLPMNYEMAKNDFKDKDVNAINEAVNAILAGVGISYNNKVYDKKK